MRMIKNAKSLKVLSAAALISATVIGCGMSTQAKEVYPDVNVPDEVYKTEYGDTENYSEIKYYKWTTDENESKVLTEGTKEDNDLKYYVSSQKDTVKDISGVIKENQNGGDINTNFIDLTLDNKTNLITNAVNNEIGKINADLVNNGGNILINSHGSIGSINVTAINNTNGIIRSLGDTSENLSVTGTFIGNSNTLGRSLVAGNINSVKGTFIGNKMTGNNVWGTAISTSNTSRTTIDKIEGVFIDNYNNSRGGAIANGYIMGSIKGIFINNYGSEGSAIWQYGVVDSIEGYFEGNRGSYAIVAYQRSLLNGAEYNIGSIKGIFRNNDGGISISGQKVGSIEGVFIDNKRAGVEGSWGRPTIENVSGYFENNNRGIANTSSSTIYNITGNFRNNYSTEGNGAAIINGRNATLGIKDENGNIVDGGIVNSNFIGNYVKVEDEVNAKGGAIYSSSPLDLNIIADNATSVFSGNYTQVGDGEKDYNAIYIDNSDATLDFKLKNGGSIIMKDNIRGLYTESGIDDDGNEIAEKHYGVNIEGDDINKTNFYLHNDIYDANVSLSNTTINTINDETHTYNFHSLTLTGDINLTADVDLANETMDRFSAKEYGNHTGNMNIVGMNLLSDSQGKRTEILFAEEGLKDYVTNTTDELPSTYQTAYTPIYKYTVTYDNREDGGYFVFSRGGKNGGSDNFNPSVLSSPVATTAATQATVNETFKYVFEHADAFTQLPSLERFAKINANKYAQSTDYNENLGLLEHSLNNKAGWFRPYVTFENMHLNHGPKVNAITYGSLVGFDTDFHEHHKGWYSVGTGYVGYNGSQLKYSNTDTTMNGGLIGYTQTFYKGNFWTALTATAGASVGETKSMYGKEDFTTLMAGLGSKTGYNIEFKEGKFILQPRIFMSYTFANTFDYTNAAGVRIKNSPAHSVQLNPSIRFIANTKNGWQPYASVGMVWNVLNENKVTANSVRLPEMGMKPYVEYGFGLQKNWKDRFTAFGQAMLRNGGRNGISLTAGFRWALGKDRKDVEKVHNETLKQVQGDKVRHTLSKGDGRVQPTKTVIKQLTPAQRVALGAKPQNTTRTTNLGVLK